MQYIIDIRIDKDKKRTYRIDAKDETEAKKRLLDRLPPQQRDAIIIDSIKIDVTTVVDDDLYGIFSED